MDENKRKLIGEVFSRRKIFCSCIKANLKFAAIHSLAVIKLAVTKWHSQTLVSTVHHYENSAEIKTNIYETGQGPGCRENVEKFPTHSLSNLEKLLLHHTLPISPNAKTCVKWHQLEPCRGGYRLSHVWANFFAQHYHIRFPFDRPLSISSKITRFRFFSSFSTTIRRSIALPPYVGVCRLASESLLYSSLSVFILQIIFTLGK